MLLEIHDDKHKRTLYVELSRDGQYWNVNSGGIFKNKYTDKNDIVWPGPTMGSSANTDVAEVADSPADAVRGVTVDRGGNSSQPISSAGKGTAKTQLLQRAFLRMLTNIRPLIFGRHARPQCTEVRIQHYFPVHLFY